MARAPAPPTSWAVRLLVAAGAALLAVGLILFAIYAALLSSPCGIEGSGPLRGSGSCPLTASYVVRALVAVVVVVSGGLTVVALFAMSLRPRASYAAFAGRLSLLTGGAFFSWLLVVALTDYQKGSA